MAYTAKVTFTRTIFAAISPLGGGEGVGEL
jgi:hypothetical protein